MEQNRILRDIFSGEKRVLTTQDYISCHFPKNLVSYDNTSPFKKVSEKLQKDYSALFHEEPVSHDDYYTQADEDKHFNRAKHIFATAVGTALVGGLIALPSIVEKNPPAESIDFFRNAGNFGGMISVYGSAILAAISAVELAYGSRISKLRVSKSYIEKKEKEREKEIEEIEIIQSFLDEYRSGTNDPSFDFARGFLQNVNLSGNSPEVNCIVLSGIARYTNALRDKSLGNATNEDVSKSMELMFDRFIEASNNEGCSKSFTDNIRISGLINRYYEEQKRNNSTSPNQDYKRAV